MKVVLSTALFPPIEYFALLLKAEYVFIEAHENYKKQSYRNRFCIYGSNGVLSLSAPVKKIPGEKKIAIKEVELTDTDNWNIIHWKSIVSAYNSSPFFLYYRDEIEELLMSYTPKLFNYNHHLIKSICKIINIKTELQETDSYKKQYNDFLDLRNKISPKASSYPPTEAFTPYLQVFDSKHGFIPNLSILDLLFNLGPESKSYLLSVSKQLPII